MTQLRSGLLLGGWLLLASAHAALADIPWEKVPPNATVYRLDGIAAYVSNPCCFILFAEPWMGMVFGVLELLVIASPAIFAFVFGKGLGRFVALLLCPLALLYILVPLVAWSCWGLAWLSMFVAILEKRFWAFLEKRLQSRVSTHS